MPRRVIFEPAARLEFEAAIDWYNAKQSGLGDRFEKEIYAVCDHILENPGRFRLIGPTVRRARVRVFKRYSVYFYVERDLIGIVAVFHSARDPSKLQSRLK
jgi:toxin ParE1/3/4